MVYSAQSTFRGFYLQKKYEKVDLHWAILYPQLALQG
jgi:hypothetical protein